MTTESAMSSHLDELDIIRHIDGEGDGGEHERWQCHLDACAPCRTAVASLREQSAAVTQWLAAASFETAPAHRPGHGALDPAPARSTRAAWQDSAFVPWLKAAAIVLLVAAPLAAIPPVRDWVAERVGLASSNDAARVETTRTAVDTEAPTGVRFVPEAGVFAVVLDGPQDGGVLRVGRAETEEALLEVVATASHGPEPVVSARELRLRPADGSTASYTLLLPSGVTGLSITIGGRQLERSAADIDRGMLLPLDRVP